MKGKGKVYLAVFGTYKNITTDKIYCYNVVKNPNNKWFKEIKKMQKKGINVIVPFSDKPFSYFKKKWFFNFFVVVPKQSAYNEYRSRMSLKNFVKFVQFVDYIYTLKLKNLYILNKDYLNEEIGGE